MYRLVVLVFFFSFVSSQSIQAQYFQQGVEYDITARQDTSAHTITASCDIRYTNRSNHVLDTIYLHLWANAFSDKLSAFSNQAIRLGQLDFYFAKKQSMGEYEDLKVTLQGNKITLYQWKGNPDVVYFLLPKKLQPDETLNIETQYKLRLPKKISRMGRTRFDHYLMYWYPSPAVYDHDGWNPMPYLTFGETYMEVADYKVEFDSPIDNIIASTSEQSTDGSLHTYRAHGINDFAIITSANKKTYSHQLNTRYGSEIDITVMTRYPKRDSSAMAYLEAALNYFEPLIGPFPYSTLAVMDKGKKSTSGMEYPGLITVSGSDEGSGDYEYYLIHELLHQWFYGALAFDQRQHAWLDEGLTTYYQQRYYQEVKGVDHYSTKAALVMHKGQQPFLHTVARGQACRHFHLPLSTKVTSTDPANYGFNAYEVPARMFSYLSDYLDKEMFDRAIRSFYSDWRGKHPSPKDLRSSMERTSNRDLSWFFDDLVDRDWSYDYSVESLEGDHIVVKHKSGSTPPYKITFITEDKQEEDLWVDGHSGEKKITLPGPQYKSAILDKDALSMDINRNNNSVNLSRPFKLVPGAKLDDGRYRELYFLPTISFNSSDGGQIGMALYNSTFPSKKLKWALSSAYGFDSSQPVGEAWISYDHYVKHKRYRKLQFKLNAKSYSFRNSESIESTLRYIRISPHISLHFKHNAAEQKYSKAYLKTIFLNEEKFVFHEEGFDIASDNSTIFRLGYERYDFWNLGPSEFTAHLEYQPYTNSIGEDHDYLKLTAAYSKSFFYSPGRSVDFRIWGAYFLKNSQRESSNYDGSFARGTNALIYQGFNDYAYDGYFFNRANQDASLDNQIGYQGGGFKTPFGSQYTIGQSNDLAFALNIKTDLPFKTPRLLPLKFFLDVGYYTGKTTAESSLEGQSIYSGGLMLEYGEGIFSVYLPLINSQSLTDIYDTEGVSTLGRISFRLDLIRFNPWDIVEDFSF